jgi:ribosomal protein L11 methyltransferase
MAACKLNSSIRTVGVDIDIDAVHIANANADSNNVDMVNYLSDLVQTKDSESQSVLLKAYSSQQGSEAQILPNKLNGPIYDVCVANILAQPLVSLVEILAGLLKSGGYLGLSGIMESQSEMIVETYQEYFDNVQVEQRLNGWVLVTGVRKYR